MNSIQIFEFILLTFSHSSENASRHENFGGFDSSALVPHLNKKIENQPKKQK